MDVEEYFKDIEPKGKRSVLEPYWPAIQKARAGGYTLDQIVGFLQNNSIKITRSGLFAFIKRTEIKQAKSGKELTKQAPAFQLAAGMDVKEQSASSDTELQEQRGAEQSIESETEPNQRRIRNPADMKKFRSERITFTDQKEDKK